MAAVIIVKVAAIEAAVVVEVTAIVFAVVEATVAVAYLFHFLKDLAASLLAKRPKVGLLAGRLLP